eukprot:229897-Chlamydomonas_euryale.AAC.18
MQHSSIRAGKDALFSKQPHMSSGNLLCNATVQVGPLAVVAHWRKLLSARHALWRQLFLTFAVMVNFLTVALCMRARGKPAEDSVVQRAGVQRTSDHDMHAGVMPHVNACPGCLLWPRTNSAASLAVLQSTRA